MLANAAARAPLASMTGAVARRRHAGVGRGGGRAGVAVLREGQAAKAQDEDERQHESGSISHCSILLSDDTQSLLQMRASYSKPSAECAFQDDSLMPLLSEQRPCHSWSSQRSHAFGIFPPVFNLRLASTIVAIMRERQSRHRASGHQERALKSRFASLSDSSVRVRTNG